MPIQVTYVPIGELKPSAYNPRTWSKDQLNALKESIKRFVVVDPIIANSAPERKGIVIGGHMRLAALKELGHAEAPVVFINIPSIEKEKEINVGLNRNTGQFSFDLLADFGEEFLKDVGFSSEEPTKSSTSTQCRNSLTSIMSLPSPEGRNLRYRRFEVYVRRQYRYRRYACAHGERKS